VRVITENREQVYSLTLPEVGETVWQPPASARRGVPARVTEASARDMWPFLALLGGIGLLAEWLMYGRSRLISHAADRVGNETPLRRAS
jgi:hypothetical protein